MVSTPHELQTALTGGLSYRTGEFRYEVRTDTWTWSDEVFRMHGFEPGEVVPTTAMILAHKHPDDRSRYAGLLATTSLHGGCFGSVHRIVDANGAPRVLATIGEAHLADDGTVVDISGHFVDVTGSVHAFAADEATRQIKAADESRAVIDQATGALVVRAGCTAAVAFDLLREASMRSNIKLRTLASQLVDAAAAGRTEQLDALAELVPHEGA
jgi:hypothetical protein